MRRALLLRRCCRMATLSVEQKQLSELHCTLCSLERAWLRIILSSFYAVIELGPTNHDKRGRINKRLSVVLAANELAFSDLNLVAKSAMS